MPKVPKISPERLTEQVRSIKKAMSDCCIQGKCKQYASLSHQLAKIGIENPDIIKSVKGSKITVPLFSRRGFNMMKIMLYNMVRRKSFEEKKFALLIRGLISKPKNPHIDLYK